MAAESRMRSLVPVSREGGHVQEMQRHRLLLAMREMSGEVGLAGATVARVCQRSRMSRRTFYELFDSRDDCFLAAFEQALEQVGEHVIPAWRLSGPNGTVKGVEGRWKDRVRAGLEGLLVLFDEQPQLARLCVVESLTGGPTVLARRREILDALAGAVDEGRVEARRGGEAPPLTAESTVGGVLAVIHARLLDPGGGPLAQLVPSLCSMIVFPYLGPAAAQRELERPTAKRVDAPSTPNANNGHIASDPFRDLPLRFTYRTARVLATIAAHPGASNRHIGQDAGMTDQGQTSKLLKRLERAGLIENAGGGKESGEANAWRLTPRGQEIDTALGTPTLAP
jgi:AcrR family transcriptional regulator